MARCCLLSVIGLVLSGQSVFAADGSEVLPSEFVLTEKSSGRAAVLTSSARAKGPSGEFEYTMEAWDVDRAFANTGIVTVKGLPGTPEGDLGDIRWYRSEGKIVGYLEKGGANVAKFSGEIKGEVAEGTVSTADGRSGTWTWSGPLPELDSPVPTPGTVITP